MREGALEATESKKWSRIEVDLRDPACKRVVAKNEATMYALRPAGSEVWYLSAYDFFMDWSFELVRYPCTRSMLWEEEQEPHKFHAELTAAGMQKLKQRQEGST